MVTFVDEGLHRQRPVPHVEGVRGLGEDPPQPQGGLVIEVSGGMEPGCIARPTWMRGPFPGGHTKTGSQRQSPQVLLTCLSF